MNKPNLLPMIEYHKTYRKVSAGFLSIASDVNLLAPDRGLDARVTEQDEKDLVEISHLINQLKDKTMNLLNEITWRH